MCLIGAVRAEQSETVTPELAQAVSRTHEWITGVDGAPDPVITPLSAARSLDSSIQSDILAMAARLKGAQLVATGIYRGKPKTLAIDLSSQLRDLQEIPLEKRRPLIVDSGRTLRANQIAEAWVTGLLEPDESDAMAVLVYWFADVRTHSLLSGSEPEPYLYLVLIHYKPLPDSSYAVARIVWGPVKVSQSGSSTRN